MFFFLKNHINFFIITLFYYFNSMSISRAIKNHGIIYLENRSNKLIVNKSNKNDVINIWTTSSQINK